MKTIGMICGMSWQTTLEYYKIINEEIALKLGGFHSAKCIMYSVDFDEIESSLVSEDWNRACKILIDAARRLEMAGADFIILCTNTMHKCAEQIQSNISIPFLHIIDATAQEILKNNIKCIGLLGTKYTMEQDFYKSRLEKYELTVVIPKQEDRTIVNNIIFNELCMGKIFDESKEKYIKIINDMISRGAEGIILGCTEIPLLIKKEDTKIPLFDTGVIHAKKAVELALLQ